MRARALGILAAALAAAVMVWHFARPQTPSDSPPPEKDSSNSSSPAADAPHRFIPARPLEEAAANPSPSNCIERLLLTNTTIRVTREQVEGYLRDNHRSAGSLLGAFYATGDKSLLAEAGKTFPNDPRVAFAAATLTFDPPEERRALIDAFKQSAPDNAIGDYLSAADYFKSGQTNLALLEVQTAMGKPMQSYHLDFLQNAAEAFRGAGYSETEAKAIASFQLQIPEMAEYKKVGVNLVNLAQSYQQAGDTASAQASLQLAMDLGERLKDPNALTMIQQLVGVAIQKIALNAMDPNAASGAGNQSVQSQLDALAQQRESFKSLDQQSWTAVKQMSDADLVNYFDRLWNFGSIPARRWAVDRFSTPAAAGAR